VCPSDCGLCCSPMTSEQLTHSCRNSVLFHPCLKATRRACSDGGDKEKATAWSHVSGQDLT
jgi:hypothetical protein